MKRLNDTESEKIKNEFFSHEFTVTFAGKWLVRELKMSIDDYENGVVIQ